MKAWMRVLTVSLSNGKKKFVFGTNDESDPNKFNFDIHVSGSKYMSSLKDTCTINISNLPYEVLVQIIDGKFYDVEVNCGYKSSNIITIFKGEVLYISNILESDRTHTVCILCSSRLLAKYGQSRMNLTLNSGINIYTALKYISRKSGIKAEQLSSTLKRSFVQDSKSGNDTAASWINRLSTENEFLIVSSDGTENSAFSVFDISKGSGRVISIDESFINLDGGYPKITSDKLNFSVMPTFNFKCGDTIKIDNSLIDISARSQSEVQFNYGYYLDRTEANAEGKSYGYYVIFEINYELENHGSQFTIALNCKSYSRISNFFTSN